MPDDKGPKEQVKQAGAPLDAAVVQIREVAKWLIGAFAAVGVALAAGSQVAEVGDLDGIRLIVAFAAVGVIVVCIAVAIGFATDVLTPRSVGLDQLVDEEEGSDVGKRIAEEPSLLRGHGSTIAEFAANRQAAVDAENDAWERYQAAPKGDEKQALAPEVRRAEAERKRIDEALDWLLSFGLYTEVAALFKRARWAMLGAALVAALGIVGFAWAAHPESEEEASSTPAVAKAPAEVTVELNAEGMEALADDLGAACDTEALPAIAVAGDAEALQVVTVPGDDCELHRFVLTPELGTYASEESVADDEGEMEREGNQGPAVKTG